MKDFIIVDTINPAIPNIPIPIADTLVTCQNSFFEGFFKASHTLLHFKKNEVIPIFRIKVKGF